LTPIYIFIFIKKKAIRRAAVFVGISEYLWAQSIGPIGQLLAGSGRCHESVALFRDRKTSIVWIAKRVFGGQHSKSSARFDRFRRRIPLYL